MSEQEQKPKPKPSLRFVTVKEVCSELGIVPKTLNDWVAAGEFPAPLRLGRRKRVWARVELEEYYTERAAEAVNEHEEV